MEIASTNRSGVFAEGLTDPDGVKEAIIDDGCWLDLRPRAKEKLDLHLSG